MENWEVVGKLGSGWKIGKLGSWEVGKLGNREIGQLENRKKNVSSSVSNWTVLLSVSASSIVDEAKFGG